MDKLLKVMRKLRSKDGCPWDREQTHQSLKKNLIEEAYEVVDAIDSNSDDNLREELGDLLLQVAFHTVIAEEEDRFDYEEVEKGICDKLVSRHTHIFGEDIANTPEEVMQTWKKNKKKEKGDMTVSQSMKEVSASYPALLRSYKVQDKGADVGFDWNEATEAVEKLDEELDEFKQAISKKSQSEMEEEAGDLIFSMVNVCRLLKIDPEISLHQTVKKFISRFSFMENICLDKNININKMSLKEWDELWDMAKKEERKNNET